MRVFRSFFEDERIIIVNLEPKELLIESLIAYLKGNNIKNACILSGIGTLRVLNYHRILTTEYIPQNEFITVEGPIELSSLQGLILNFEPHLHFVASDLKNVYSGHLEYNSEILYLAEISLIPLEGFKLRRVINERKVSYIKEDNDEP